jgi:hypothetical protein
METGLSIHEISRKLRLATVRSGREKKISLTEYTEFLPQNARIIFAVQFRCG